MRSILFIALILVSTTVGAQVVTSDFTLNADGWTAPNSLGGAIIYSGSGGNPGGYVQGQTPMSINTGMGTIWFPYYFEAPAKFEGNKSAYYGGSIRYDAAQSSTGTPVVWAQAVITTNTGVAIYYYPNVPIQPPTYGTWTNFGVPLSALTGEWKTTDSATGPAATQAQVMAALSDIMTLQIQGLYRNANVSTRLDNIMMHPPITITTHPVPATVCENLTATFSAAATNNPNITYQWQLFNPFSGFQNISDAGGYSGTTTATLSVNTTGNFGAGTYRARISGSNVDPANTNSATLTINPAPAAPGGSGGARCGTGTVPLTATGGAAGQYRWYTVATLGTPIAGQTGATYVPTVAATTNYWVAINNGTCESLRTNVVATVNTIPGAPGGTGAARCGPGTVALTATGGAAGQYRWYTVATLGTPIPGETAATYTTPTISTTTNYWVSINNGFCEGARTMVVATVNTLPAAPGVTGASNCGNGSVTLTANGGAAGQYRWYTVATLGTAISGETAATYATPVISSTTNYWVAINNGTCESTRTMVVATINTVPTAPGATGASNCGSSSLTLTATGGAAGQYRWYTVATLGIPIPGQTAATYATPVISTTTNYWVAINNGTCESTRTNVVATINTIPGAAGVTGGSRCGTGTVGLTATGGAAGQYRWYTVATLGTPIPGQTAAAYTTPSIATTTNYWVAINNGFCEGARTMVVATVNTLPAAPGVTGASNCGNGSVTLTATGGAAGQYRWYTVATLGTAIPGETAATYTTPVITSTTNYWVAVNNGSCEGARTMVTATINTVPNTPGQIGATGCSPGSVTLQATGGLPGTYRWYTSSTGPTQIAGEVNNTYTTPLLTATTQYWVSIHNGTCESGRIVSVAAIFPTPQPPTVTGGIGCATTPVTLTASGGSSGQYRWYDVATGGTPIVGQTNNTFTTPAISATTSYWVSIRNGACESSRTEVVATFGGQACLNNTPPVIETTVGSTTVGGIVTIPLESLISDDDNNLVLSTLTIVIQPPSGATATIDTNNNLIIDYTGKPFSGTENISISVCDTFGACTVQQLSIDVITSIEVYNGISPNKDGKNDVFYINGIEQLEKQNRVLIFNRWGDLVWEGKDYDNVNVVFKGVSKSNSELPAGTYFYKIEFPQKEAITGYLSLMR